MAQFSSKSVKAKAKGVTSRQAALAASLMKSKKAAPAKAKPVVKSAPMDAEDLIDGGVDEATEKN